MTLVEGRAFVCPRKPNKTFEQQLKECSQALGGARGGHCDCLDLKYAGQTALAKKGAVSSSDNPVQFASLCSGDASLCSSTSSGVVCLRWRRRAVRPLKGPARLLSSASFLLALVAMLTPDAASASCTYSTANNVFALTGDFCGVAGGAYNPPPFLTAPPPVPVLSTPYTGFAFLAYGGGTITEHRIDDDHDPGHE